MHKVTMLTTSGRRPETQGGERASRLSQRARLSWLLARLHSRIEAGEQPSLQLLRELKRRPA